jgi:putative nucleotidyltransferase with HDIG domain
MLQILFVDDEQKIRDGLKRTLRPLRHAWNYEFAPGGVDALQMLNRGAFDVVVTDVRMPVMDGMELLKQVKTQYPHLLRIVLSGQSELENLIKSSGISHQYLTKPCSLEELKAAVERASLLKRLLPDPFLAELASEVDVIPSVSPVYWKLGRLLKSPLACAEEAGSVVAQDMGLCAKVLQTANSGCFARIQFISDPTDAVGLLGPSGLQNLSAQRAFQECKPQGGASFDMDRLWRHSLQCSRLAREIAGTLDEADDEVQNQAGVAGLLHDVGKLIMACNLPEQYERAAELAAKEGLSDVEAERRVFQTSHAELGAYVMALWNIPDPIVEAIAYHHAPAAAISLENPVLTAVHAAELACR